MQRLTAQPLYAQLLAELPNYNAAVDLHLLLHDMVGQQVSLRAAQTKASDAQGVLLKHAVAGEYTGWPTMVQVGCRGPRSSSSVGGRALIHLFGARVWDFDSKPHRQQQLSGLAASATNILQKLACNVSWE
jgi:hypothetical protein